MPTSLIMIKNDGLGIRNFFNALSAEHLSALSDDTCLRRQSQAQAEAGSLLTPHAALREASLKKGFTLIEILLVLTIMGLMAGVTIPKLSYYFEPPAAVLQRAIEEAGDKALSGTPVRLSIKSEGASKRGYIFAEALTQREIEQNSLSAFLGTNKNKPVVLEWQTIKMRNMPDTSGWKFEPEVINFFSDGSCTPAKISWENPDGSRNTDEYVLTVTGYCMLVNDENAR